MVVGHEGVELQGVELEAGVVDVLHVLHGVLVHGQQGGGLEGRESILQVLAPCQSLYYAATKACDEVFFHVSSAITLPVRVRQWRICAVCSPLVSYRTRNGSPRQRLD